MKSACRAAQSAPGASILTVFLVFTGVVTPAWSIVHLHSATIDPQTHIQRWVPILLWLTSGMLSIQVLQTAQLIRIDLMISRQSRRCHEYNRQTRIRHHSYMATVVHFLRRVCSVDMTFFKDLITIKKLRLSSLGWVRRSSRPS